MLVAFLVVKDERERVCVCVVTLHLTIELELVPRCELSTYQPISHGCLSHLYSSLEVAREIVR